MSSAVESSAKPEDKRAWRGLSPRGLWLAIVAPLLAWTVISGLVGLRLEALTSDGRAVAPVERVLFHGQYWVGRYTVPGLIVLLVLGAPLLTIVALWCLSGPERPPRALRTTLWRWIGAVVLSGIAAASLLALDSWSGKLSSQLQHVVMNLSIAGLASVLASQAIVVALSYRAQRLLRAHGRSKVPAGAVLVLASCIYLVWYWPVFLVAAIPLAHRGLSEPTA